MTEVHIPAVCSTAPTTSRGVVCLLRITSCAAVVLLFATGLGAADPAGGDKKPMVTYDLFPRGETNQVDEVSTNGLPYFMRDKRAIPDRLLELKKVGVYYTAIPLIGFDPEKGFNYGVALQRYNDGPRDSPFFSHAPYRNKMSVSGANSTGGAAIAVVAYDAPYINDTPWRFRAYGGWVKNDQANFFGSTDASMGPLRYPGSPMTFAKIDDYYDSQEQVINGQTYAQYNKFKRQDFAGIMNLEYDLLGGRLRPLIGIQVVYTDIKDYTGESYEGGVNQTTLLRTQQEAGQILGFNGGWNNLIRFGLTYDTRDYEPNPTQGVVAQLMAQGSSKYFGSDFTYTQVTLNVMGFYPLFPKVTRLVLAGQMGYSVKSGDVPFFAQPNLALPNNESRTGLGGFQTMRGFVANRFVSDVAMNATAELRWTFGDFNIFKQDISTMLVPFVDSGRVFDAVSETTLDNWRWDAGIGLRLAWNVATIISFDFGASTEGTLFWMEIGHQF